MKKILIHPERLELQYGSFFGGQRQITLKGTELMLYGSGGPMSYPEVRSRYTPTDEEWSAFRAALNSLSVWKWQTHYDNPGVTDGAGWRFIAAYRDKKIETSGDNNYPNAKGQPNNSPERTKAFQRLCDAASDLSGGFKVLEVSGELDQ